MKVRSLVFASLTTAGLALAQPAPPRPPGPPPGGPVAPQPPMPPEPPGFGGRGGMHGPGMHQPPGIPPQVAQKLGIPADTVKKVRDMSFDANAQLIQLEADLKRAQLDLDRVLSETNVDEAAVMGKLDGVSKAELAVRKNRMGLMVKIRKLLGNDTWEKLQGEMHGGPPGAMMMMPGPGGEIRREVRVIRDGMGGETVDVRGGP